MASGSYVGRSTVGGPSTMGGPPFPPPARPTDLPPPLIYIEGPRLEWIEPTEPEPRLVPDLVEWRA